MSASRSSRAWPVLTLGLVAASAALEFLPHVAAALRFEREALHAGELWRFFTGHLVHRLGWLAALDLLVLLVLGAWWERRSRGAFVAILIASAVLASAGVLVITTFATYVGSSAISSGLFAAAALELGLERGGPRRIVCALALLLFALKCIAEARGGALFVELPRGTSVSAAAHALGAVGGVLVALVRFSARSRALAGRRCC